MRDGLYLSVYIHIDPIAHLYDFHIRHDQNISLWKKEENKVQLIHLWELERITGLKRHHRSFYSTEQAREFIEGLLKEYNISLKDLAGIIGTPQLDTISGYDSAYDNSEIAYHSICHLYSSLMMNTKIFHNDNIIALALDGGPDTVIDKETYKKQFYAGALSIKGKVEMFPVCSPGFIWTYLRKKYNMREGSLMALATASKSELYSDEDEIVKLYNTADIKKAYKYIDSLALRAAKISKEDEGILFNEFDPNFSDEENRISMAAKIVQKMSIRILEYNIDQIIDKYNIDPKEFYVAISGGFGLNCPTNSYLMKKYHFKGFIAPPCVNDAGLSLGMALYYFSKQIPNVDFTLSSSYFGDADDSLDEIIKEGKYDKFIDEAEELNDEKFVRDIQDMPVIWFDGRAEIGPRALGHRSLIVAPTKESGKDQLNVIKKRQWWRPVAPIVLYEEMGEWFEADYYSPFMLHTVKVKKSKKDRVPSICHLDDSARVQSLKSKDNPVLYRLIKAYKKDSGVPIICNTSLNDIGEPIINTIEECLNFALRKHIKIAYINQKRIKLKNHEMYTEKSYLSRPYSIELFSPKEKNELKKKYNPFGLNEEQLICKFNRLDLNCDITKKEDAEKIKKFARLAAGKFGKIPVPGLGTKKG